MIIPKFTYEGSFALPKIPSSTYGASFASARPAACILPNGNMLVEGVKGGRGDMYAEVTIPALSQSDNPSDYPVAEMVSDQFFDPAFGVSEDVTVIDPDEGPKQWDLQNNNVLPMPDGRLLILLEKFYNTDKVKVPSRMFADLATGETWGPYHAAEPAFTNRINQFAGLIPPDRHAEFGEYFCGGGKTQGRADASEGPAFYGFDATDKALPPYAETPVKLEGSRYLQSNYCKVPKYPGTNEQFWNGSYQWAGLASLDTDTPDSQWYREAQADQVWLGLNGWKRVHGNSFVNGGAWMRVDGVDYIGFQLKLSLCPVFYYQNELKGDVNPDHDGLTDAGVQCEREKDSTGPANPPYEIVMLYYRADDFLNPTNVYCRIPVGATRLKNVTGCCDARMAYDFATQTAYIVEAYGIAHKTTHLAPVVHVYKVNGTEPFADPGPAPTHGDHRGVVLPPVPDAVINSFTATPKILTPGETYNLLWHVTGASCVEINGQGESNRDGGLWDIAPDFVGIKQHTLVAQPGGVTKTVTVEVLPAEPTGPTVEGNAAAIAELDERVDQHDNWSGEHATQLAELTAQLNALQTGNAHRMNLLAAAQEAQQSILDHHNLTDGTEQP